MELEKMIDYTVLKPEATVKNVRELCHEAREYGFYSVCVNPCHIRLCRGELEGSDVKVCTVIGFPLGALDKEMKALEAGKALELGADELDMVINLGYLKSGMLEQVWEDIEAVVGAAGGRVVKAIIEAGMLSDDEKKAACTAAKRAGASFVKTSTGFGYGGATTYDVKLMRQTVGKDMGVKASGGIKTKEQAMELIKAGANRIGTSTNIIRASSPSS
jgi:deoxyribose-phosphate aldolase